MKWDEFRDLLVGMGPDTPLGRIVAIRSEDDKDILKNFSPEQMRIRNTWRTRNAKAMPQEQVDNYVEAMKQAFIKMANGR